jgi:hypothetical protein
MTVETIGALEDQYGDRYLDVGCRRKLNKRMQDDGGSPQKTAVARRWLTRPVMHARGKNRSHKRPTVEKTKGLGIQQRRKSPWPKNSYV